MPRNKVITFSEAVRMTHRAKAAGKKVVTTNGCFDIMHVGHARYLKYAKSLGDVLIVGINSDRSVKENKGPLRPIVPERERAEMLVSLEAVDGVFIFDEKTPTAWLSELKPHIHVKGADRKMSEIVEKDAVGKNGGKIVRAPYLKGKSTTNIVKKIIASHSKKH